MDKNGVKSWETNKVNFFFGKQTKWMLLSHQNFLRQYLTNRKKLCQFFNHQQTGAPSRLKIALFITPHSTDVLLGKNVGGKSHLIFRKSDTTFHWFLTWKIRTKILGTVISNPSTGNRIESLYNRKNFAHWPPQLPPLYEVFNP